MLLALALAVATPSATEVAIPQGDALAAALTARDAEFFALVFDGCDRDRLAAMLTPDCEMYHDRDGVVARSSEAFVQQYGADCVGRQGPDAWRSRRELVAATLNVQPVPGFGAIEDGEHLFYERHGDGPERLAGRARFTQLQLTPEGWRPPASSATRLRAE